tara:strand:+ start:2854 stop:3177 length:324 start_codon:yes stop_codon:yes gene_type:complete
MKENLEKIKAICGEIPENQDLSTIASDPNFIFVNDLEFNTIRLFDIDGNIINVNSWIECAHYVNGGWDINQITGFRSEVILFGIVSVLTLILLIYKNQRSIRKYVKI